MNAQPQAAAPPHEPRALDTRPPLLPAGFGVYCLLFFLVFRLLPAQAVRDGTAPAREPATPAALERDANAGLPAPSQVATLLHAGGDVEVRDEAGTIRSDAHGQAGLHAGDVVHTFARSRALLRLGTRDYLALGERSQIAFGTHIGTASGPRRVTLVAGTVSGALGGSLRGAPALEVEVPGARVSLLPGRVGHGDLRFLAVRNPDATSSISLFAGWARVAGAHGTESLTAGDGVTLDSHGRVQERRALPSAPDTLTPSGGTAIAYRDVPPRIEFRWSPVAELERYRLRIAGDSDFRDLLVDERVAGTSFTLSSLDAGVIYWSVSSLEGRLEGRPSVPRRLRILQDADAPALSVDAHSEADGVVAVRGRTEPGTRVYVQGEFLISGIDGAFETRIAPRTGAFLLVVEAVDAVGNVSYDSRIYSARDDERAAVADTDIGH